MPSIRSLILMLVLAIVAAGAWSCRDATEIVLNVRTNVDCSEAWQGVAIYVGAPGIDVETKLPSRVTSSCVKGGGANGENEIGTLVLLPTTSNDEAVAIRVVAGVSRTPDSCATSGYEGCIVSAWNGHFSPHQSIDVALELEQDCVGVECDLEHSCFHGSCGNAAMPPPVFVDAGPPMVYCGDQGTMCSLQEPNASCCLTVTGSTASGDCRSPSMCLGIVLECDDESDCSGRDDGGLPTICCASHGGQDTVVTGTKCASVTDCAKGEGFVLAMCQDRSGCLDHTVLCTAADKLPGYFTCVLP